MKKPIINANNSTRFDDLEWKLTENTNDYKKVAIIGGSNFKLQNINFIFSMLTTSGITAEIFSPHAIKSLIPAPIRINFDFIETDNYHGFDKYSFSKLRIRSDDIIYISNDFENTSQNTFFIEQILRSDNYVIIDDEIIKFLKIKIPKNSKILVIAHILNLKHYIDAPSYPTSTSTFQNKIDFLSDITTGFNVVIGDEPQLILVNDVEIIYKKNTSASKNDLAVHIITAAAKGLDYCDSTFSAN